MPLPQAVQRKPIHTRDIVYGLWDIEGHLVDTKAYAFDNEHRGQLKPGSKASAASPNFSPVGSYN